MKDIIGYEGLYAITSCGKVWSYRSQKFLKPGIVNGYLQVWLCKGGITTGKYIHSLVAEAYIPNPLGLTEVNHKDEVKNHNYINNLEWCDRNYNNNYGSRNQRVCKPVRCIELDRVFESVSQAAQEIGISISGISNCCRGRQKTTGGYHWKYEEVLQSGKT